MTKNSYLFLSPIYIYIRVVNTVRAAVSRITNDKATCSLKKPQMYIYIYIRKTLTLRKAQLKQLKRHSIYASSISAITLQYNALCTDMPVFKN